MTSYEENVSMGKTYYLELDKKQYCDLLEIAEKLDEQDPMSTMAFGCDLHGLIMAASIEVEKT